MKDRFLGLAVEIVPFVVAVLGNSDLIHGLERNAYDMGARATDRTPSERTAVITIDDASTQFERKRQHVDITI